MNSGLAQIRQECLDELSALEALARVPLIAEDRGDVAAEVLRALAWDGGGLGRCGAFIYFLTEAANVRGMGDWGLVFGEIQIGVMCVEAPELNRGPNGVGKTALELAEVVLAGLNLFRPASGNGPLVLRDPALVPAEFGLGDGSVLPGWEVRFELPGSLGVQLETVAPVSFSAVENGLEMDCATEGAAIFFTTDGSRPNPQSGQLYTGPVSGLEAGTLVRARGFLSGRLLGPVSEYVVTASGEEVMYLVDENGNRLTDESGNRLTVE